MKKKFIPTTFTLALATLSLALILPTACTRDELITPVHPDAPAPSNGGTADAPALLISLGQKPGYAGENVESGESVPACLPAPPPDAGRQATKSPSTSPTTASPPRKLNPIFPPQPTTRPEPPPSKHASSWPSSPPATPLEVPHNRP